MKEIGAIDGKNLFIDSRSESDNEGDSWKEVSFIVEGVEIYKISTGRNFTETPEDIKKICPSKIKEKDIILSL